MLKPKKNIFFKFQNSILVFPKPFFTNIPASRFRCPFFSVPPLQSFLLYDLLKTPTPLKTHRHPISAFCFIPSPASLLPPAELNGVCWCQGSRVCSVQLSSAQLGCRCYKLGVWLLSEPDSSTQDVCTDGYYVIGYSQPWKEGWERAKELRRERGGVKKGN